jgi:tetratricopeptide (TPR) repeat protein
MKKIATAAVAVILISALAPAALLCQEGRGQGRLTGLVVDEDGKPVEGAKISLRYEQFSNTLATTSNSQGQWGFIGLGRGAVTLTVVKEGYEEAVVPLMVSGLRANPTPKITLKKKTEGAESGLSDADKQTLIRANALFDEGQYTQAAVLYRSLLEASPALYQIRLNLANALMELQDYNQAEAEYKLVLDGLNAEPQEKRDAKSIAQVTASLGEAFLSRNMLQEAEEYFIKSLEINPSDPALPFNVAEILMQSGDTQGAVRYYEMAVNIKPDWPKAYLKLGYAWLNKGENDKAVESFKKVLAVAPPDDPDAELARDVLKALSGIK